MVNDNAIVLINHATGTQYKLYKHIVFINTLGANSLTNLSLFKSLPLFYVQKGNLRGYFKKKYFWRYF